MIQMSRKKYQYQSINLAFLKPDQQTTIIFTKVTENLTILYWEFILFFII